MSRGVAANRSRGILYGVGYEGRSAEQLVELLVMSQVDVLVDVRLNAVSRKPGLSKRKLAERLEAVGIEYVHEPLLGNPADNRDGFRNGHLEQAKRRYAARLQNGSREALLQLLDRARTANVAMLCFEAEQNHCHRQVICEAAELEAPSLPRVAI